MDMRIFEGRRPDSSSIAAIIRSANRPVADRFGLGPENAPSHPSFCRSEWIETAFDRGVRFWLLEADGWSRGCVGLEQPQPEVCYLERLAVEQGYQGLGFGRALVRRSLTEAKRAGATRVEIGIIADHTELRCWYEHLGFVWTATKSFDHLPFEVAFMAIDL